MPRKGVSGSGGFVRPTNFIEAEARVLWENAILIPLAWHLPHGWNVSATGYAIPPITKGPELDALIDRCWQMLLIHERELLENASCPGIWLPRLQWERHAQLAEFTGPHVSRYNIVGWRVWWQNRYVDDVLREHGYVPPPPCRPFSSAHSAPTQAMSRSSFSDGCFTARSGARSAPYPPPARSTGIVIRDAGGSSSAPPCREKKEEPEEEEWEQIPPELLEETRPWWVVDQEMLVKLSRHLDDPEDAFGLSLIVAHSLAGAGGAARGAPGGQPVFNINDRDEDVKPDLKKEDGGTGSSSRGRRCGGRGRYGGL
jgi:hypothetical protein